FRRVVASVGHSCVPGASLHFPVPRGRPAPQVAPVALKIGARRIALFFALTIATAIAVHSVLHLPAVIGMMTGLGYLQLLDYFLQLRGRRRGRESDYTFNVFHRIAGVEWDTLLFFYGVMMCIGALGLAGYLSWVSHALYGGLGAAPANVLIGIVSAVLENIPLMYGVLTMQSDVPLGGWGMIRLTAGGGGSRV